MEVLGALGPHARDHPFRMCVLLHPLAYARLFPLASFVTLSTAPAGEDGRYDGGEGGGANSRRIGGAACGESDDRHISGSLPKVRAKGVKKCGWMPKMKCDYLGMQGGDVYFDPSYILF